MKLYQNTIEANSERGGPGSAETSLSSRNHAVFERNNYFNLLQQIITTPYFRPLSLRTV